MLENDTRPTAATFLFADIAGFTALTEAHGDEEAAKLVADFSDAVEAELPAYGASQVKTIGDALMLRIPEPERAVTLGLRIANDVMSGHGAPAVRVGMHHGTAIERDSDYIGGAVNLAARVSAAATGGEVLLTAQTAALAPVVEAVLYESRGRQTLRNVREPVELVAAVRQGQTADDRLAVDPVCKWWSIRTTLQAVSCTKTRPTSSAPLPAPERSPAIPSALPADQSRGPRAPSTGADPQNELGSPRAARSWETPDSG